MIISILSKCPINKAKAAVFLFAATFFFSSGLVAAQESIKMKEEKRSNPFGALEFLHWNSGWNNYKYPSEKELKKAVALMKEAGVGMVRMDFLWQEIEPEEGVFDFRKYDNIVDIVTSEGLQVLGLLNYSAPWASTCGQWNCPPSKNKSFVKYAQRVVSRYKDVIKHWEIWNEPDSSVYWSAQDGLKGYCALLKEVYPALKKVDPDCVILNGGLANGMMSVNRLYENGAKGYFDVLNIHYFDQPDYKGALSRVTAYPKLAYKVMVKNGDAGKKIWITEIGCPGVKKGLQVKDWWLGKNPDENEQALWVTEVFTGLLKDGHVEKVFWAFFRDTKKHWNTGVDYFGLVRWDFSKKPAYQNYRKCFQNWQNKAPFFE